MGEVEKVEKNPLVKFDQLAVDIKTHVEPCLKITVKSMDEQKSAYEVGKNIKAYQNKVEDLRKKLKEPYLEMGKKIDAYAKKISAPLDQAESHIKGQLRSFEIELDKIRQEEFKKAEVIRLEAEAKAKAELAEKEEAAKIAAMFAEDPVESENVVALFEVEKERVAADLAVIHSNNVADINSMKGNGVSKPWAFDEDGIDVALLPKEFMKVDPTKIRQAVAAGVREIPGVRIFQDTRIAFR